MNRFNRAVLTVSILGASLTGCASSEKPAQKKEPALESVSPENDPRMRGRVDINRLSDLLTPYTPQECTANERGTIAARIKDGTDFNAEFYVPNDTVTTPEVAVREKDSTQHNGAGLRNPIVLRCGGKVVEYASIWYLDGPQSITTDRDITEVISAEDAIFFDAREKGKSPSKTATRNINELGHFATFSVRIHREEDSVDVYLTDGQQRLATL